jgi:hypothetical protein
MAKDLSAYRQGLTDNSRWDGFAFRPDDIVISTRSKCGTTCQRYGDRLAELTTPDCIEWLHHEGV